MLGARMDLDGSRVADLFAGSGALGLEAVSRGAASAVLVESDRRAAGVVRDNIAVCGAASRVRVVNRSVESFVANGGGPFDLVFVDPPYGMSAPDLDAVLADLVRSLADDAWVVVERGTRDAVVHWPTGLESVAEKKYGDTMVLVASRVDSAS